MRFSGFLEERRTLFEGDGGCGSGGGSLKFLINGNTSDSSSIVGAMDSAEEVSGMLRL